MEIFKKRVYSSLLVAIFFSGLVLCSTKNASAKKTKKMKSIDVPVHIITTKNASGLGESVGIIKK